MAYKTFSFCWAIFHRDLPGRSALIALQMCREIGSLFFFLPHLDFLASLEFIGVWKRRFVRKGKSILDDFPRELRV